jgi:hypothetical protein
MPPTGAHHTVEGIDVKAIAAFAAGDNVDGFFGPPPAPDDPQQALRVEQLRSLGYITPTLGGFMRLNGTQLRSWSWKVDAGPDDEAVLSPVPDGGQVLVPVIARRTTPYEVVVRTADTEHRAIFVSASSPARAPVRTRFTPAKDSVLITLQAGPNLLVIGNEGHAPVRASAIVVTPR